MSQMMYLPKVDEKATRARLKKAFERYHDTKATLNTLQSADATWFTAGLQNVGGSGTAMYPVHDADMIRSGKVHNTGQQLSELAEKMHAHQEHVKRMRAFCESIERVVDNLPQYEREVMRRTLMINKYARNKDSVIWPELNLTKNVYYDHKEKAMLRIAFALRIEVYEKEEGAQAA